MTSEEEKEAFLKLGLKNNSVFKVPNPVKLGFTFSPIGKRNAKNYFGFSESEKIILFCSRINRKKGLEYIIKALKMQKNVQFKLIVAGTVDDPNYFSELKTELIKMYSLTSSVYFVGHIEGKKNNITLKLVIYLF